MWDVFDVAKSQQSVVEIDFEVLGFTVDDAIDCGTFGFGLDLVEQVPILALNL